MPSSEPNSRNLSVFLGLTVGVVMGVSAAVAKGSLLAGLMIAVLMGTMVWGVMRRLETRLDRSRKAASRSAQAKENEKKEVLAAAPGRRAIVVDDDRLVGRLAVRALEEMGWQAEWVSSGVTAIERYRRDGPFELMLVDYMMPDLNGAETMHAIRSHDPEACFILISGMRPEEMNGVDFEDPAMAFLAKPFDLAQLRAVMDRVLAQPG